MNKDKSFQKVYDTLEANIEQFNIWYDELAEEFVRIPIDLGDEYLMSLSLTQKLEYEKNKTFSSLGKSLPNVISQLTSQVKSLTVLIVSTNNYEMKELKDLDSPESAHEAHIQCTQL